MKTLILIIFAFYFVVFEQDEMESKPKAELAIPVLVGAKSTKSDKKPVRYVSF